MRGVTKPVELQAELGGTATDFYGNHKAGFEVTGKINRQDFGPGLERRYRSRQHRRW